ncbi:MAG: hypothetical protein AABW41_00010 [Nanoarchaeota archaeon]
MIKIKKSQVGFEFLLIIGVVLLIFVLFFAFTFDRNADLRKLQDSVDEKKECIRLSNLISGVYKNGPGTEVTTKTNHVLTVYNDSVMQIQKLENTTVITNKIAVLLSESGVSTQDFYNRINSSLHPDFYKWCSDDWDGGFGGYTDRYPTDCNPNIIPGQVNWNLIPKNLSDLIANLDNYNTVYLEDPHLHPLQIYNGPNLKYQGMEYPSIFQNWTHDGGVLITSEHFFCIDNGGGYLDELSNHWQCKNTEMPSNMGNIKVFFGRQLYGYSGAYVNPPGRQLKIVNKTDPYTFNIGDTYGFSEPSCIKTSSLKGNEDVISKYVDNMGNYNCSDLNAANSGDPTILTFRYGSGMVHYIADFEVISQQTAYSDNLVSIIKNAYFLLVSAKKGPGEYCVFYGNGPYNKVTGNITIRNDDNTILVIQNPT